MSGWVGLRWLCSRLHGCCVTLLLFLSLSCHPELGKPTMILHWRSARCHSSFVNAPRPSPVQGKAETGSPEGLQDQEAPPGWFQRSSLGPCQSLLSLGLAPLVVPGDSARCCPGPASPSTVTAALPPQDARKEQL